MALRVSGKNLDIGEALQTHVRTRIDAAVEKYFSGAVIGHVTIEPEGSGYRTDCTLHLPSGITLQVDCEAHEPYASFNRAADRIEKRLRRYKRRLRDHHGPDGVLNDADDGPIDGLADDEALQAADGADDHPAVIAETFTAVKSLSVSAAVAELDTSSAPLVIFRHASNERVNIVYRRHDGHIGWIDPARETTSER